MTYPFALPLSRSRLLTAMTCGLSLGLWACGGSDDSSAAKAFVLGGSVSGLTTSGLVLQSQGADDLVVPAHAEAFVFATGLSAGQSYDVSVKAQPDGLECAVDRGQGRAGADVTDVQVSCAPVAGGGGGGVRTGAASECLNPALVTPGTKFRWHTQTQVEGQLVSMIQERQIEGGGTFGGVSGLLVERGSTNVVIGNVGTMNQSVELYSQLRNTDAGPVIVQYGGLADSTSNVMGMVLNSQHETLNTPATEKRDFTLKPGQSYQHSSVARVTSTIASGGATVTTEVESYQVDYLGQKEVKVAAGTYLACHFLYTSSEGPLDVYIAVGSGLPLVTTGQVEDGIYVRMEMQPDSHVNGVPVSQYHASHQ